MRPEPTNQGRAIVQSQVAAAVAHAARRRRERRLRATIVGGVALLALIVSVAAIVAGRGGDDVTAGSPSVTEAGGTGRIPPTCPGDDKPPARPAGFTGAPPMCLVDGVDYSAVVVTSEGSFTIDLFEDRAPVTVNNFVFLAKWGWYDHDDFHRVVRGFMNQGGDPVAGGTGNPGYGIPDELPDSVQDYVPGAVAMANAGPNTNGSQFFVCVGCQTGLGAAAYSLFGQVTDGMDVVIAINDLGVGDAPPSRPVAIESITIVEA